MPVWEASGNKAQSGPTLSQFSQGVFSVGRKAGLAGRAGRQSSWGPFTSPCPPACLGGRCLPTLLGTPQAPPASVPFLSFQAQLPGLRQGSRHMPLLQSARHSPGQKARLPPSLPHECSPSSPLPMGRQKPKRPGEALPGKVGRLKCPTGLEASWEGWESHTRGWGSSLKLLGGQGVLGNRR